MTIRSLAQNIFFSAVVLFPAPALADVKSGVEAWSRGDYAAAVREWQGPAQQGDADAQFNLAQAYKLGRGVKTDLAKAEELFARAAARGHMQAADNLGLLLFQRGERARAMPYVSAAAGRGDPRAMYLLGIAHFNGDNVPKDWVRAYALVSLAQQAGLAQAAPALAQMDQYIPIGQRQESARLAGQLAGEAEATRERQLAAADLGATVPVATAMPGSPPPETPRQSETRLAEIVTVENAVAAAERAAGRDSPGTAGADYARPRIDVAAGTPRPVTPLKPIGPARIPAPMRGGAAPVAASAPTPAPAPTPASPRRPAATPEPRAAAAATSGAWRVQLGAFGMPGNADALWNRVKARPEVAGRSKLMVPAGRVTKLQAGGFASLAEAQSACSGLSAAGFTCIAVRN
jgi:cell division septation protein DedD